MGLWRVGDTVMRHIIAEAGLRNEELIENFQGDMPFAYCARDLTVIPYARLNGGKERLLSLVETWRAFRC